jgi:hypothetical protein
MPECSDCGRDYATFAGATFCNCDMTEGRRPRKAFAPTNPHAKLKPGEQAPESDEPGGTRPAIKAGVKP